VSLLAYTANTWTEVIVACSIFIPLAIAAGLTWFFLRGKSDDPDEQRWARLEVERREAQRKLRDG
jgi:hypothetical protein